MVQQVRVDEQWQLPVDKLLILARAGVFGALASTITIDVDSQGNFQNIWIRKRAYKRGIDIQNI